MSQVVIIFEANTIETEQLALAVAIGAVEAEASIRLRRLVREGAPEVAHKGYGVLKEADLAWADTIVVGLEPESVGAEVEVLLSLLRAGGLEGKQAWTFGGDGLAGTSEARRAVEQELRGAGARVAEGDVHETDGERIEKMKAAGRASAQ